MNSVSIVTIINQKSLIVRDLQCRAYCICLALADATKKKGKRDHSVLEAAPCSAVNVCRILRMTGSGGSYTEKSLRPIKARDTEQRRRKIADSHSER